MAEVKIKTTDGNNAVTLAGPASGADVTLKLPTAAGSAGQYLKTDGSNGQLSFATVASPVTALNNATANELVTVGSTTTELDAEANLTFDGTNLTLGTGNLILGTAGKGIDFAATGDGSGTDTSELLEDYEEGEWTPVFNTGAGAISNYANNERTGKYIRVGHLCYVSLFVRGASNSGLENGSGDFWITGLPYAPAAFLNATINDWCYLETANDGNYYDWYITAEYYNDRFYIYGRTSSSNQVNMGSDLLAGTAILYRGCFRIA